MAEKISERRSDGIGHGVSGITKGFVIAGTGAQHTSLQVEIKGMTQESVNIVWFSNDVGDFNIILDHAVSFQRGWRGYEGVLKRIDNTRLPANPGLVTIVITSDKLAKKPPSTSYQAKAHPDNFSAKEHSPLEEKMTTSL